MAVFNYYPDQLRAFASICKALNEFDKTDASSVFLKGPIALADGQDPESLIGHLVDEIGGSWSDEEYDDVEPDEDVAEARAETKGAQW